MSSKKTKTPLVKKVKDHFFECRNCTLDPDIRQELLDEWRKAYRRKYVDGCCPSEWIEDEVLQGVKDKFAYVLHVVAGEVSSRVGVPPYTVLYMVDPSYDDTTWFAVLYDPFGGRPALLYFESCKAWNFCWDSDEEMEAYIQKVADKAVANLMAHLGKNKVEEAS